MYSNIKDNEIKIFNRGKVAYLHVHNEFEDRIEKREMNGKEQWCWIFQRSNKVFELLKKFNENEFLKTYNSAFKNIAYDLARVKTREAEDIIFEDREFKFEWKKRENHLNKVDKICDKVIENMEN